MPSSKNKRIVRDLAIQRIRWLYKLSINAIKRNDKELARRYVDLILSISRKANVRLPRLVKRSICRNCKIPLIPGVTARVRLKSDGKSSWVIIKCLECGWIYRYPYKPRKECQLEGGKSEHI